MWIFTEILLSCCLSLKSIVVGSSATGQTQNHFSQITNYLQHFSPTTSFHLCIQPLPVRPRPGPPPPRSLESTVVACLTQADTERQGAEPAEILCSRKGIRTNSPNGNKYLLSCWNSLQSRTKGACVGMFLGGLWFPCCSG